MRRPTSTIRSTVLMSVAAVALVAGVAVAGPAAAQEAPADGCAGDLVTASMSSATVSGPAWSVTKQCVDARNFFTGTYEGHAYAVGISPVTYDDGHVARLAFMSVRIDAERTATVIGMEDPATSRLHYAGSVRQGAVGASGATVEGSGIGFPPLEAAQISLDYVDTQGGTPEWLDASATSTTIPMPTSLPAESTTTAPQTTTTLATAVPTSSVAPTTTVAVVPTSPTTVAPPAG